MENLKQAGRNLSTDTLPIFFSTILCFVALLQFIFFSVKPFCGNYSTFDSHTNIVISHMFAYSSRWRRKPWQDLYTSKTLLLKELYRFFQSIIAVVVIFLLGFHEFCCDAGSVFPWCDVDNQYRIPKQIKFEFTLPLDSYMWPNGLYYASLTILKPFLLYGVH